MDAALALLSLCLVAAVYVWQTGRTERQRLAIGWERERFIAAQHAEAKRWEEAVAAVDGKLSPLLKRIDDHEVRLTRAESGRVELKRTA